MNEELIDEALVHSVDEDLSSGGTLIDSTQNAIVGAAQNVSQALDAAGKAALEHNIAEAPFYLEVHFWIGLAFVLAVLVLFKPALSYARKALQRRIQRVVDDIDEAVRLRDDAQQLLAEYERKFVNVKEQVRDIVEQGQKSLLNYKNSETAKLRAELHYKEKETARRINASTVKAQQEINQVISNRAVYLAQRAIENYVKDADKSKLIDEAIADLDIFIK